MKRRKFLKNNLLALTGLSLIAGVYTWQIEPYWLEFVKIKMPVKNLPNHLIGKTLMQISDIHVGKRIDYRFIIKSFNKARLFKPDFVVYTGDYVSSYRDEVMYDKLQEVLNHSVKGKIATIGILGNHDYGENWIDNDVAEKITSMLNASGIKTLRNEHYAIDGLNFLGIDDYWGLNFNPEAVMKSFDKSKANIALCHNPDVCDLDIWNGFDSWILSGHTHGGQCKPPFLPPPILPVKNRKYSAGLIKLSNGRTLYINRALGFLLQVRFNVRPEITIFELIKAS